MKKPEIIFENEEYIAFNKPTGMLSIQDRYKAEIPNLAREAQKYADKIFTVHRIDKDTSGIVCFAKTESAHKYLSQKFENIEVKKEYLALVYGTPINEKDTLNFKIAENPARIGKMHIHPKGKTARTDYELLEKWEHYSLLKIRLFTGRTHQIRVHLNHIGIPIVADPFYGKGTPFYLSEVKSKYKLSKWEANEQPLLNRLALHASLLEFEDAHGKLISIQSPLPKDINTSVKQLRKWDAYS